MTGGNTEPTGSGAKRSEPSYEAARAELTEVVRALESGGQSLEESLRLWQRGEDLALICQRCLDGAAARLDEAITSRDPGADGGRNAAAAGDGQEASAAGGQPQPGRRGVSSDQGGPPPTQ
jgi:exodeoxyribonuclease VII small subunit